MAGLNPNLCSLDEALGRIIQDITTEESMPLPQNDMRGWILDASQQIGWTVSIEPVIVSIEIENYKFCLPEDVNEIINAYVIPPEVILVSPPHPELYQQSILRAALEKYGVIPFTLVPPHNSNSNLVPNSVYRKGNFLIFPTTESGTCYLVYNRLIQDDENNVMIPDHPAAHDAYAWYCIMKLSMRGYEFLNTAFKNYDNNRARWAMYRQKAKGILNMPSFEESLRMSAITKSGFTNFTKL